MQLPIPLIVLSTLKVYATNCHERSSLQASAVQWLAQGYSACLLAAEVCYYGQHTIAPQCHLSSIKAMVESVRHWSIQEPSANYPSSLLLEGTSILLLPNQIQ